MTAAVLGVDEVLHGALDLFADRFAASPAGVFSAPGRVNLIGEHVDYAGGFVLPFALGNRTAVAVTLRGDGVVRCVSTRGDRAWEGRVAEVGAHRPTGWAAYAAGVVWAMVDGGILPAGTGADIAVHSSVPVGSGLSSSAALECAVALAMASLTGAPTDTVGRRDLVTACIRAENEVAGANTGGMDQNIAMHARAGHALLLDCRSGDFEHVPLAFAEDGLQILVVDTNAPHRLVDGQYGQRRASVARACAELGVATLRDVRDHGAALALLTDPVLRARARHVLTEIDRVRAVVAMLQRGRPAEVGPVLTASHASLRDDFEVSSVELDSAVDAALDAGALGARMTGGGFGGSAIALVPRAELSRVIESVSSAAAAASLPHPTFLLAEPSGPATTHQLPTTEVKAGDTPWHE